VFEDREEEEEKEEEEEEHQKKATETPMRTFWYPSCPWGQVTSCRRNNVA
jgi:hypothetical protein